MCPGGRGMVQIYSSNQIQDGAQNPNWKRLHLRSSSHRTLVVPRTRTSFGDRACGTLCRLRYDR